MSALIDAPACPTCHAAAGHPCRGTTSPDEWHRARAGVYRNPCTSSAGHLKRRFPTREVAWCWAALVRLQAGGHLLCPYHCPQCSWFHLTTARGERRAWTKKVLARIHRGEQP